jgi:hypothetical protein
MVIYPRMMNRGFSSACFQPKLRDLVASRKKRMQCVHNLLVIASTFLASTLAVAQVTAKVDVLTQHNDWARTGANLHETVLTPTTVNARNFGLLFKRSVDDQLYTQPLYLAGVEIAGGVHDVVYVTTVSNSVYAFDANDPAAVAPLWQVNFGAPANFHDADFGCTDINGNMGIIGTPVIDRASRALYVVALTKAGGGFTQRLHALDPATGADLPASPVEIKADGFNPLMQNQRPGLLLANGTVYVGYASHCDKEPYHGYLFGYDAKSLQQTAVLNTSPTGEGASIWQSGQPPAADSVGNIYVVTGNGSWDGKTNFSESFLKLDPHLKLLDWFTPTDHLKLDAQDNDLNSSGARSSLASTWSSAAARAACFTASTRSTSATSAMSMRCSISRRPALTSIASSIGRARRAASCSTCGASATRPVCIGSPEIF